MNAAVIVARTLSGKLIAGECSESIAALTPKMLAIRDAGKLGNQPVNRVAILSTWAAPDEREVPPQK